MVFQEITNNKFRMLNKYLDWLFLHMILYLPVTLLEDQNAKLFKDFPVLYTDVFQYLNFCLGYNS